MKIKQIYKLLGISILSFSLLAGCNKPENNSSVIPTMSESLLAVEIPEPEPIDEPEPIETSGIGTDGKSDEEIEQELNEVEDITVEDTSNFSGGDVDYSNEPWYVEGIDYSYTNNGQGWDFEGQHYDTYGEKMKAFHESMNNLRGTDGWFSAEEVQALANGEEVME